MDTTQPTAPPQLSPDGQWWWDGAQWVPAPAQPVAAVTPPWTSGPAQAAWGSAPTGHQPQRSGPDGLAIASLALGVIWLAGFASVVAVILGHVSRSKAKKSGREPSGLALAGLILGYVGCVFSIPVLAAIAIPTFLEQRDKGYEATVKADLRAAAVVQEELYTDYDSYVDTMTLFSDFTPTDGVELEVLSFSASSYCMTAQTSGQVWYLSSDGIPTTTPCA